MITIKETYVDNGWEGVEPVLVLETDVLPSAVSTATEFFVSNAHGNYYQWEPEVLEKYLADSSGFKALDEFDIVAVTSVQVAWARPTPKDKGIMFGSAALARYAEYTPRLRRYGTQPSKWHVPGVAGARHKLPSGIYLVGGATPMHSVVNVTNILDSDVKEVEVYVPRTRHTGPRMESWLADVDIIRAFLNDPIAPKGTGQTKKWQLHLSPIGRYTMERIETD